MAEVLSQDEIDSLLSAIANGEQDIEEYSNFGHQHGRSKVRLFDYRKPQKFTKSNLRNLRGIFNNFSSDIRRMYSLELGIENVYAEVAAVTQMTYAEFMRSLPSDSIIATYRIDNSPLNVFYIAKDPSLVHATVAYLTGGSIEDREQARKSHKINNTDIGLITDWMIGYIGCFKDTFPKSFDSLLDLLFIDIKGDSSAFNTYLEDKDQVISLMIEITLDDFSSLITVCLPFKTIERTNMKELLENNYEVTRNNEVETDQIKLNLQVKAMDDIFITLGDLKKMKEGDVIKTKQTKRKYSLNFKNKKVIDLQEIGDQLLQVILA